MRLKGRERKEPAPASLNGLALKSREGNFGQEEGGRLICNRRCGSEVKENDMAAERKKRKEKNTVRVVVQLCGQDSRAIKDVKHCGGLEANRINPVRGSGEKPELF